MNQAIVHVAVVVKDYDEAIKFYIQVLDFELITDIYQEKQNKRWVVVAPKGGRGTTLLLAKASDSIQEKYIGNQTGNRVFLFLNTDDFWRDYKKYSERGVKFIRSPIEEDYGMVAVFEDIYGNRWDLLQLNGNHPIYQRVYESR